MTSLKTYGNICASIIAVTGIALFITLWLLGNNYTVEPTAPHVAIPSNDSEVIDTDLCLIIHSSVNRDSFDANTIKYCKSIGLLPEPKLTRGQLLEPFLSTIKTINSRRLPFDEPRVEIGQQDGRLRPLWRDAWVLKKHRYQFNGEWYSTYHRDGKGKLYPFTPQVCSDYIVDSLNHSLGNWYAGTLRRPYRTHGEFDIRKDARTVGKNLRRIREMVAYMKLRPDHYEFVFEGNGKRVGGLLSLKKWLAEYETQKGDIILISGRVPWDTKHHSHSFIVTRMESETGYVSRVSGNAGLAMEWGLGRESKRSPDRTVRHIIRLTDSFLKKMR